MYYYSFLTSVDKSKCDVYVTDIYKACSLEVVGELKKIQKECAESNSMVKGPENAQRKAQSNVVCSTTTRRPSWILTL